MFLSVVVVGQFYDDFLWFQDIDPDRQDGDVDDKEVSQSNTFRRDEQIKFLVQRKTILVI